MAHQQDAGAVDAPVTHTDDSAAAAFKETLGLNEEPIEEQEPVSEIEEDELPVEGDPEADVEDEEGEQEEVEPEEAIDVPVSLTADEKEVFAQLPPEAQQAWADSESRRNADVTKVTTKAANAQREAEAIAANAHTQAQVALTDQMDAFVAAFEPEMPDLAIAQHDPQSYVVQKAQYDQQLVHFQQLKEQVSAQRQQIARQEQAQFIQQRDQALLQIPEIANPETRDEYLSTVFAPELLTDLSYDAGELTQVADAKDVMRLRKIAEWREKAAKYDKATSKPIKRDPKGRFKRNKPGVQAMTSGRAKAQKDAIARQRQSGNQSDTQAAFKALVTGN